MPEQVKLSLTLKEYAIISELRKIKFGEINVHKVNGEIVRILVTASKNITNESGLDALRHETSAIAFIGESSMIKSEEVDLVYGKA